MRDRPRLNAGQRLVSSSHQQGLMPEHNYTNERMFINAHQGMCVDTD